MGEDAALEDHGEQGGGGPSKQGCEGCHGLGADHVAGGGDKSKIYVFEGKSRQETSTRCLTCHGEAHEQGHFPQSAHASSEVGCLDCHSPHHAEEKEYLLVRNQPDLCYGCHTTEKADFAKPFHHRVNEGLVQCKDCHNPHGTGTVRQVRALPSGDAVCFKCHADKQGPFVYEHVPVKIEGCTSCHTPHGSTNPRLLRVSVVNMLCLQCHTFPTQGPAGLAHNQSAKYQACTMCHTQIHGSNFRTCFSSEGIAMKSGKTDLQIFRGSPAKSSAFPLLALVSVLIAWSPVELRAQSSSASPSSDSGVISGDYQVHATVELGMRANGLVGSADMYDTLVNLREGPRFLSETLSSPTTG